MVDLRRATGSLPAIGACRSQHGLYTPWLPSNPLVLDEDRFPLDAISNGLIRRSGAGSHYQIDKVSFSGCKIQRVHLAFTDGNSTVFLIHRCGQRSQVPSAKILNRREFFESPAQPKIGQFTGEQHSHSGSLRAAVIKCWAFSCCREFR